MTDEKKTCNGETLGGLIDGSRSDGCNLKFGRDGGDCIDGSRSYEYG